AWSLSPEFVNNCKVCVVACLVTVPTTATHLYFFILFRNSMEHLGTEEMTTTMAITGARKRKALPPKKIPNPGAITSTSPTPEVPQETQ
ncbi:unnamed protein product, partial [Hymenolepis diminuta]